MHYLGKGFYYIFAGVGIICIIGQIIKDYVISKSTYGNITLTPVFEANTYVVTLRFGLDKSEQILVTFGESVTLPIVEMEGYTFDGWYRNGKKENNELIWSIASDVTYIAQYNINSYTINFDTDGGSLIDTITKKYGEERSATPTRVLAIEAQQQREFYVGTQMETQAHNLYLTDAKTQDMHDGADYAGAALLWQETINKVKQHDFDEAYAVGLDEKTVEKMIEWEQNGQSKYLDQIHGLAELDIAHMGSPTVGMGGESLMGMQTALAQNYAIDENQKRIEKAKVKLNDLARNESGARDAVKRFRAQIDSLFSIDKFNEVYIQNKVTDIHDHQITSTTEFTKALDEVLAAVESNELNINSNKISSIMQAMNDFRNAKIGTPGFESIIESAAAFNDMVAQADRANKLSAETDATNAQINDLNSKIQEQLKKMKYLGGGKKG